MQLLVKGRPPTTINRNPEYLTENLAAGAILRLLKKTWEMGLNYI